MDPSASSQPATEVNNSQLVDHDLRLRVYDLLADEMIKTLQNPNQDVFNVEESQQSAEYVLDKLEQVKTKDELLFFLKQLSERWPIYHPVYIELHKEYLMTKVQSELDQLKGDRE